MGRIRRLVLDTLKPHDPSVVQMAARLTDLGHVDSVNVTLVEVDRRVENVKITLEGQDLDYASIEELIVDLGGAVHSIDQVVAGEDLIEDPKTPQD